jgi:predicted dehydrogenase
MDLESRSRASLRVALVGCGALSELYYAPALAGLACVMDLRVAVLVDPCNDRLAALKKAFPTARAVASLAGLKIGEVDVAIVASPQRFHAEQTISLLSMGVHVLCEKPMAATVMEAEQMTQAAKKSGKVLAVGLFRRFFPVNQTVREIIRSQSLGAVKSFEISEGGLFNWPAQSASFFQKSNSQGGVLADLGVHVLDLLIWWFGVPESVHYEDDAMGGLEANCQLALKFSNGVAGSVRLSRDTQLPNRTIIECERGWLRCKAAAADQLELGLAGASHIFGGQLVSMDASGPHSHQTAPALNYQQSFSKQLKNVIAAVRGEEPVFIPGEEGILSLRLIEHCYRQRKLMPMPWLEGQEYEQAKRLSEGEKL